MGSELHFRAGVGLLVLNQDGLVLAFERSDIPGAWQAPQGGLELGEVPLKAAARELLEETGIGWETVEFIGEHPSWLTYELPSEARSDKVGRGQAQRWFLVRYTGDDASINVVGGTSTPEFTQWRWLPMSELVAAAWRIRQGIYHQLAHYWDDHFA